MKRNHRRRRSIVDRLRPAQLKYLMAQVEQGRIARSFHIKEHGMSPTIDLATNGNKRLGHLRRAATLGSRRSR